MNYNVWHAHKLHIKRIIRNFHKQIGEQKEMVTNKKPDFNNIEKASWIMMGIIMEFLLDGTRQGMFVHDGIRQAGKPDIC